MNKKWNEVWERIFGDIKKYGSGILIVLMVWFLLSLMGKGICPLSNLFGLPCPGCGLTRSLLLFLTGNWKASFAMHPFAGAWVLFFIVMGAERYYFNKNGRWKSVILIVLLASMLVYYIYKMKTAFPGAEPYVYLEGNLTEKRIPGYWTWIQQVLSRHLVTD